MKETRTFVGIVLTVTLGASASVFSQTSATQSTYITLKFAPATPAAFDTPSVRELRLVFSSQSPQAQAPPQATGPSTANPAQTLDEGDGVLRYPGNVHNFGGPTVASAQMHAIFMQQEGSPCAISVCWGNPEGFLKDLGRSDFIHVADQYVGNTSDDRYTVGQGYISLFQPLVHPFTDADMQAAVTAAAQASGQVGYGHIYHVFLPPGADECLDSTFTICYSPDNPATWGYCAYHSYFDVPGLGHLLYTFEPYQNVGPACADRPGTPNGPVVDNTNDTLLHETFETITDPDVDAWINNDSRDAYNGEIGDLCIFLAYGADGTYVGADPSIWSFEGRVYASQPIYNNNRHACTTAP